jgi:hypothetical protein
MPISYYDVFNLNSDFNWKELDNAYRTAIEKCNLNMTISDVDKQIYREQIDRYYRQAKNELVTRERQVENNPQYGLYPMGLRNWMWDGFDFIDKMERRFNNSINEISFGFQKYKNKYGYNSDNLDNVEMKSESYFTSNQRSERRLNDGSLLVINNSSVNENGQEIKNTETYIISKDGNKKYIDIDTAKLLLQN